MGIRYKLIEVFQRHGLPHSHANSMLMADLISLIYDQREAARKDFLATLHRLDQEVHLD